MIKYFDKLYSDEEQKFYKLIENNLKNNKRMFIITANPEAFTYGKQDVLYDELLLSKDSVLVPDGIGIVKAARKLGYNVKERITGIDLATKILEICNKNGYKIALLGATEEVITNLQSKIKDNYPNITIVKAENGYTKDKDTFFNSIINLKPDVCLVALGMPMQEKLIYKHLKKFKKGIFVGVGGSFDVLSGTKKRAPKIFLKTNTEWLYRIIREPKRIKRFYNNNVKFLFKIKKLKRKNNK